MYLSSQLDKGSAVSLRLALANRFRLLKKKKKAGHGGKLKLSQHLGGEMQKDQQFKVNLN